MKIFLFEFKACVVEFMATFIMALAICASWDPRNYTKGDSVSLRIGLIVFLLNITAGAYTGASMNPARSFGPTVWNQKWDTHWVSVALIPQQSQIKTITLRSIGWVPSWVPR
jgi:aquaporin related protein